MKAIETTELTVAINVPADARHIRYRFTGVDGDGGKWTTVTSLDPVPTYLLFGGTVDE